MAAAATPASQQLPPAELQQFKLMTRHLDAQDYAKALKLADTILSKAPDHADTMTMKALCLHGLGKVQGEDGAYVLAKAAIAKFMQSPVCWHGLGIIYRKDKNYAEALKCFKNAVRREKDDVNQNLLRDLTYVCVHVRDWEGFEQVRQKALHAKANVRYNWVSFAVAHHMLGNYAMASAVIEIMAQVMDAGENPVEMNEINLYRAELSLLTDQPRKALAALTTVTDGPSRLLLEAKAHEALGQTDKAVEALWAVMALGLSERDCIIHMARARGFITKEQAASALKSYDAFANAGLWTAANAAPMLAMLDEIAAKYPRCDAAKRLALDVTIDEADFTARLKAYTLRYVVKTIPSLDTVLDSLYSASWKVSIIESVFQQYEADLVAENYAAFGLKGRNPTLMVCVLTFLASHFRRKGDYATALRYADRAIDHTPTIEMLYLLKAKIVRRMTTDDGVDGYAAAAELAEKARTLDLQDKYVNGKAAKYMLRAGDITRAEKTLSYFHKDTGINDTYLTMFESQCSWYEIELGNCYLKRKRDPISALQAYKLIEQQHDENHEELIDFHNYTLRRCNVRQWIDVIQSEDHYSDSKFYLEAAPGVVESYLLIHEMGEDAARAAHVPRPSIDLSSKDAEEKTRVERLIKQFVVTVDTTDPLTKALPYLKALQRNFPNEPSTHRLAFRLHLAAKRPVLCAQALRHLKRLSSAGTVPAEVAQLTAFIAAERGSLDARVTSVVSAVLAE